MVRFWFGCAAFSAVPMTAQAQTYYYYPTSVPAAPSVVTGANFAVPLYVRGRLGNRVTWYTYPAQSYQTAYTTQNPQTTVAPQYYQTTSETQSVQASSDNQVPATNTTPNAAPVATVAVATVTATTVPATTVPATTVPATTVPATAVVATMEAGDPYGFLGWLNATRAAYGLPAVAYDPNLSGWAAMNNDQQAARGMGHFVMGPARRQNSAMGAFGNIGSMWMNSPAHRAALLDPTIRAIGIAGLGAFWTFNAY
jgi:uncharacterized protein YkwD